MSVQERKRGGPYSEPTAREMAEVWERLRSRRGKDGGPCRSAQQKIEEAVRQRIRDGVPGEFKSLERQLNDWNSETGIGSYRKHTACAACGELAYCRSKTNEDFRCLQCVLDGTEVEKPRAPRRESQSIDELYDEREALNDLMASEPSARTEENFERREEIDRRLVRLLDSHPVDPIPGLDGREGHQATERLCDLRSRMAEQQAAIHPPVAAASDRPIGRTYGYGYPTDGEWSDSAVELHELPRVTASRLQAHVDRYGDAGTKWLELAKAPTPPKVKRTRKANPPASPSKNSRSTKRDSGTKDVQAEGME